MIKFDSEASVKYSTTVLVIVGLYSFIQQLFIMPGNGDIVVNKADTRSTESAQSSRGSSQTKMLCFDRKGTGNWAEDWVGGGTKVAPNRVLVGRGWFSFVQEHLLQHKDGVGIIGKRFGSCS